MAFLIKSKLKGPLLEKSKASKKALEAKVSLASMAASKGIELLPEITLGVQSIASLKGLSRRVRKSEREQVERVAKSLTQLGQCAPILIAGDRTIINGHIVVQALRELGETQVWCACIEHLDEHQIELLHVTLNRIGECGDWDLDQLRPLLVDLGEIGLDLEVTGFSLPELDILMSENDLQVTEACEGVAEPPAQPTTIFGDLWLLDNHRLLCADSTVPENYQLLLQGVLADCVFTDCPWNIPIDGFVSGLGSKKHKDFAMAAGEMSEAEFIAFCETFHKLSAAHLADGGAYFSCIDWRSIDVIMTAAKKAGLRHINTAVWNKGSGGMGSLYRSAQELIPVFCKGPKLTVNNVALGKHGRDRTNVWSYPGANRKGSTAGKALQHHPTPKPIELVRDAILDVTKRGARVLDPFMGSGTTILAAEKSDRLAFGIELDPGYVDVAISRWQEMTGRSAIHEASGLTFQEVAAQRSSGDEGALAA